MLPVSSNLFLTSLVILTLFVFLQETLASNPDVIKNLRSKWRGPSFWSPAVGKQGGVALLVHENSSFEVKQWKKDFSGRIVSALATLNGLRLNLVNIYAPTNPSERKVFFDTIPDFFFPHSLKIIGGDFNCFESEFDKFQGNICISSDLREFRTLHRLINIWRKAHGRSTQCTWFNSDNSIGSRLDKFLIHSSLSPHTVKCEILPCVFSDHDSVHGPGVWRLNLDLLSDKDFCAVIVDEIQRHVSFKPAFPSLHDWWELLKDSIRKTAIDFGKQKFRKINSDRVRLTNSLITAKRQLIAGNSTARFTIERLESQLNAINFQQQKSAQVRSRAQSIEEGEKPSKYFFRLESNRIEKSLVNSIFNSHGVEVSSQPEIEQAHFDFYRSLYSKEPVNISLQQSLLSDLDVFLSEEDVASCEEKLSLPEITTALNGFAAGKTPGPDGLPKEFYAKFWDILSPHLLDLYNFSFEFGCFSESMQSSITRLIYKKGERKSLKNWRPISLLNVDYKIASKALANRLLKVLPRIIHSNQTCSVPGRTIFENLFLLRDTLDHIERTNETGILVSLDQEKAFDRLDRSFLTNVLHRFGFGPDFSRWINTLYSNASMKVIVNGYLTESIPLERGVRQGDSLSPLLYILCAEVLANSIRRDPGIRGFLLPEHVRVLRFDSMRTTLPVLLKTL